MNTKDRNRNNLSDGDSVTIIKDLKLKGTSTNLKRGSVFKNIRLINTPEEIECHDAKSWIVLKTMFVKKV